MGWLGDSSCSDSDADLLRAARGGDAQAFAELWRRHVRVVLAAVHTLAHNETEDVVSEAFAQVWEQLLSGGGGPRQNFRAYVITVSKRLSARRFQEQPPILSGFDGRLLDALPGAAAPSAEEAAMQRFEDARMREAFCSIPERWQRVLWLQVVERCPRAEIGHHMQLGPNSVSALSRRARHGLRRAWHRTRSGAGEPEERRPNDAPHSAEAEPVANRVTGRRAQGREVRNLSPLRGGTSPLRR